jgi:hypothetical protein
VAAPLSATARAVALFERAGLLDDPVQYVSVDEFAHGIAASIGA